MGGVALADVNGVITPLEEARISVLDRGFLFGDAIYEVIRVYGGRLFYMEEHMERLCRSCEGLSFQNVPPMSDLAARGAALVRASGLAEAILYYQVTRGAGSSRSKEPDPTMRPTIVITVDPADQPSESLREEGATAITVPETRWDRADLKTVNLIPRILVRQKAKEQGAYEAIWVDEQGEVLEASASNVFAVIDGMVVTPPLGNRLLAGITRAVVLDLTERLGIPWAERTISLDALRNADEIFLTGSVTEVLGLSRLDNVDVGSGKPGPITRQIADAFFEETQTE
jgi:D-alanine transaminase